MISGHVNKVNCQYGMPTYSLEIGASSLLHNNLLPYYNLDCLQIRELEKEIAMFVGLVIDSKSTNLSVGYNSWKILRRNGWHSLKKITSYVFAARCFSSKFEYNIQLTIFIDAVVSTYNKYEQQGMPSTLIDQELFNSQYSSFACALIDELMEVICHLYRETGYAQRMADERQKVQRLRQSSVKYINSLIAAHSKIIAIRLDFYQPMSSSVESDMQQAIANMDRLLANSRHNSIFNNLLGYIVKLEYGIIRGAHWHAVFFFNGQLRNPKSHVFLAKQIGDYWEQDITGGYGTYYNCNADIEKYEHLDLCGIGLINYYDLKKIQNLKDNVASYLCKTSLLVRIKSGKPFRRFRHGQSPLAISRCPRTK